MNSLNDKLGKVAIIADQMTAFGGAEREMFSILKLLPNADIFTITIDKSKYPQLKDLNIEVKTSFVQNFSKILPKGFSRHLKILNPFAYESFNLEEYDYIISISAGPGKGVITGIQQPHIAMVMTPPRSLWDKELNARGSKLQFVYKAISNIINNYLRIWDYTTSKRIDYWTANSQYIAKKIEKTYNKKATVIHPGVEEKYYSKKISSTPGSYFLVLSRLYDHKRIDWAIRACKEAKKELLIIGEGPDKKYLQKIAKGCSDIKFLGFVPDDEVLEYYNKAQALIFCGLEDFGLVPVEAMASGTPVLAYRDGGLLETVKEGITGEFFQDENELIKLLKNFDRSIYNGDVIRKHASRFSEEKFLKNLEIFLLKVYEQEKAKKEL
jgi:glycosyltransferase involved in cell wall biosynthesis